MDYIIRQVEPKDLEKVAVVEEICFPASEAAKKKDLDRRIQAFPECFFVAEGKDGSIIGFINGAATDKKTISDDMFEDADLHKKDGMYQSIFGLDVLPEFQKHGIGAALMKRLLEDARGKGRKGMILTCKERLIPYYSKFGYQSMGISESVHGGAVWYDMIMEF